MFSAPELDRASIAGICPTIALGGYATVDGYYKQMRQYTLAVDRILSARVVLANSTLTQVSASKHADLGDAMSGGGKFGTSIDPTLKSTTKPSVGEGAYVVSRRLQCSSI